MSQLPEIPASAYTPEMNTLGAIPDIPIFEGEWVPVSRNALTPGTRPLQLLPLPGTEFPVRHETGAMRGFQTESRHAGRSCVTQLFWVNNCVTQLFWMNNCVTQLFEASLIWARPVLADSTDASAFWDLLDPPMRSRVVATGFGDYAAGLRRTQPRFPPATCYALMERWNDCTHTFIFGFGEMTLTPVDYTAITRLRFNGPVAPLDARYQTAALGAELVHTLLGVTTHTRYTAQRYVSYKVVYRFWTERIRTRLAAWREFPADARPAAPVYTREERDQAARSFIFYLISSQLLCTSQNKGDLAVLACLRDLSRAWAYEYRIYPGGLGGDASADARQIPRYLGHRHHTFSSSEDPHYWRCYLNDRALSDLLLTPWEGDAWEAYPARAVVATAQRRVPDAPPRHMCLLEGMTPEDLSEEYIGSPANIPLSAGYYATYFSTRLQARLSEVREYIQERKKHRMPAFYRAQAEAEAEATAPAGPAGAVLDDVPFRPGMEVALDPALGLGSASIIPADLRQAPPPLQLDPEHTTHDLEIGRLRRHQSRQSSAVTRLQMKVDRLRTRLEVKGIPLDFSEDEEDGDDGSSSDDAPPSPPSQAAAGPSRRRRINAQLPERSVHKCPSNHHQQNQVSSFVQSIPDDLWQIHPLNQLAWLIYFKDLKPDHSFLSWLVLYFNPTTMVFRFEDSEVTPAYEEMCAVMGHHPEQDETPALPTGPRHDLAEIAALCPVYLPDGIDPDQGLPLEPFLRVHSWVRDIALHVTDFNVHHRGCPMLLQAWALDKLSLIPPVPARLIPTYGPAHFRPRSRGHFDFGDKPVIRWTCPWWRIRMVTAGTMNLSYVLYSSLNRSMAYFPDGINRQYSMIQRVPKIHDFESGPMTQSLLTNLADRWRN
ncbi:hypothetical protein JCGZ_24429 [Jatropha curcas]|uniref:Aminotransferase-like plant mobile domain-containing protein n=1 Tax=Jatropha curcas TaxID=180498 RepID=A0A067JLR6_JATCU|nr:hypothetical protein JCGZ_24429 [Jatropha curcas]